jgi:hypothetical protein
MEAEAALHRGALVPHRLMNDIKPPGTFAKTSYAPARRFAATSA